MPAYARVCTPPEIGHRREESARASVEASLDRVRSRELLANGVHPTSRPTAAVDSSGPRLVELHVDGCGRQRASDGGGVLLDEGGGMQLGVARARAHLTHEARVEDVVGRAEQEALFRAAEERARCQQRAGKAPSVCRSEVDEMNGARTRDR